MSVPPAAVKEFVPELDGLRALAVLGVVFFHVKWLAPGWLGVNLFFVISGFLITGILLDTRDSPGYFRRFYIRRFLRIFPIYYLLLAVVCAVLLFHGHAPGDMPYFFLYLQNFVIANAHWMPAAPDDITHTWSLAVEEQFYLVWPLAVLLVTDRRKLQWLCAALFALALVFRAGACARHEVMIAFAYPFGNMDSLAAGAFLAVSLRCDADAFRRRAQKAFYAGLALLLGALTVLYAGHFPLHSLELPKTHFGFVWGSIFAVIFALFVMAASCGVAQCRWLGWGPLRFIGKISYGIYLYHYALRYICVEWWFVLPATAVVAALSWYCIERPCLRLKANWAA